MAPSFESLERLVNLNLRGTTLNFSLYSPVQPGLPLLVTIATMKGTRSVIQRPPQRLLLRNSRTCPSCSFGLVQRRAFSHVTPRRAVMGQIQWNQGSESTKARDKMQSQQSMMKNASKTQIPTDMGLMPTTFVSPSVRTLFRMYRNEKKKLLRILMLRLRRGPQTLFT